MPSGIGKDVSTLEPAVAGADVSEARDSIAGCEDNHSCDGESDISQVGLSLNLFLGWFVKRHS